MTETSSLFPYIRVFSCTEYWVQVVYSFPKFTPLLVPLASACQDKRISHPWDCRHDGGQGGNGGGGG